jgi:hypothetical protein
MCNVLNLLQSGIGASTSLYFYSAFFQGNAALIALTATFTFFRHQGLRGEFKRIEDIQINHAIAVNLTFSYDNISTLEAPTQFGKPSKQAWNARKKELVELIDATDRLWRNFFRFFSAILLFLFLSIVVLPFSDSIHKNLGLEFWLFISFIIFQAIILYLLFRFCKALRNKKC